MNEKTEEDEYNMFLFLIEKQGKDIFNIMEWDKKQEAQGNQTEEDYITVKKLFQRFDEYCLPKKSCCQKKKIILEKPT